MIYNQYHLPRLAATAATCLFAVAAMAQQITVNGRVVDEAGEPTIGATVMVVGSQNGAATDLDGKFVLKNVKAGTNITIM